VSDPLVRLRLVPWMVWGGVGLVGAAAAGLVTGTVTLPPPFDLGPELSLLGLVFLGIVPLLLSRWRMTFWVLLAWFMVEDLIRKSLGNDIRVYFLKDAVFLVLVAGLLLDNGVRGSWRAATGSARAWLYAMIAWSLVMSVPLAFSDWRIPLIALKLDWQYVPLVVAAFVMAREEGGFRRLLTGFVALSIPVCLVGVIQGSVGPSFLRPEVQTPGLDLVLIRAHDVFQPTGPFADGGRFGYTAMLSLVLSLSLYVLTSRAGTIIFRAVAIAGILSAAAAVWVHASKTNVVVAPFYVMIAALAPSWAERRPATVRALTTLSLFIALMLAVFLLFPTLSSNRTLYLRDTLDPSVPTNEWDSRANTWWANTTLGLDVGGPLGAGTGASSLGLQYLGVDRTPWYDTGVTQVEGGYAGVLQQWGFVGLVLWLGWTLSWLARALRSVSAVRGHLAAGAGLLLCGWITVYLFVGFVGGFQGFQNYITNAYLWILFGMLFALPFEHRPAASRRRAGGVR
jgi:hypothetical protein